MSVFWRSHNNMVANFGIGTVVVLGAFVTAAQQGPVSNSTVISVECPPGLSPVSFNGIPDDKRESIACIGELEEPSVPIDVKAVQTVMIENASPSPTENNLKFLGQAGTFEFAAWCEVDGDTLPAVVGDVLDKQPKSVVILCTDNAKPEVLEQPTVLP